jgi:PadR family transcriptional regulator, regulatory protein AphA
VSSPSPKSRPPISTTGYALLGMLAIRPLTSYELAKRFDRSLGRCWPRARSTLVVGPKRLVELNLATASAGSTGRRPRTVYSITPTGRQALRDWLAQPGGGPALEFEQALKVFFAEHAGTEAVRTNLAAARAWAAADLREHLEVATALLRAEGQYTARRPQLIVVGTLLSEFTLLIDRWARWAEQVVEDWPADPADAESDLDALRSLISRLEAALRGS